MSEFDQKNMSAESSKHLLYFFLEEMEGTINLDIPIPAQSLTLKAATTLFKNNATANANCAIYFEVDWMAMNQITTNVDTIRGLPILTGPVGQSATSSYAPDIQIGIHKAIPNQFHYRVLNVLGECVGTDVVLLHLVFEYDLGIINSH